MRLFLSTAASILALAVGGCAVVGAVAAAGAKDKFQKCQADIRATPEAQMLTRRLWQGDSTDTAAKLSDPNPLTPAERDALVKIHPEALQCRQIIINHDSTFAAWELPYWQAYFARTDQLFTRLASGEMPVGVANKLYMESTDQFQTETSQGRAEEVRFQQVQSQRAAEALVQANATIMANQPRMTTTTNNCMWSGNMINCTGTSMR
jgi:hypothetical protein